MEAKTIQRYSKYSVAKLKLKAQVVFNKWVRFRSEGGPCISCGSVCGLQAGHFYSAGHCSALRFEEDNCWGQCIRCNHFLSGNLNQYRINLEKKIGKERLRVLDEKAAIAKRNRAFKWSRETLILIVEKYKIGHKAGR